MHRLMSVRFLMYLFMNDFLPCSCCNLMMFYDWRECVVSVLGTTKHSSATVLTLGNKVYCIALLGKSRAVNEF